MDGGWPQLAQADHMFLGAVAFMLSQSIAGVNLVKLYHQAVSRNLSYDGSAGD